MFSHMKFLHTSMNTDHSGCRPSTSMSFYSFPYISPLPPPHFYRPIPNQSTLQMSKPSQSAMPRSPHPPLCTPRRLYKSTLRFLSFSNTPHIHLSSIPNFADMLSSSPRFQSHMSIHFGHNLVYLSFNVVQNTSSCQDRR